jgi:hypothetical protein
MNDVQQRNREGYQERVELQSAPDGHHAEIGLEDGAFQHKRNVEGPCETDQTTEDLQKGQGLANGH